MREPLVTAVIPTLGRRPERLSAAVASVAAQTHDRVELVIVDDSAGTVSERVAADYDDLDVRCLEGSGEGVSAARNAGIRAAHGEFVAFLDDDDRWRPQKTTRQLRAFETRPEVGLVCVGQRYEDDAGTVVREHAPTVSGDVTERLLRGKRLAPTSSAMARTALVREHDCYFDERLAYREDNDWYVRLSRHCAVASVADPLVVRGIGDYDRLSTDFDAIDETYYDRLLAKHRPLAAEYGCEDAFVADLSETVAVAALGAGRYAAARRYALRALAHDPSFLPAYLPLLVGLGGRPTHRAARTVKRVAERVSRATSANVDAADTDPDGRTPRGSGDAIRSGGSETTVTPRSPDRGGG